MKITKVSMMLFLFILFSFASVDVRAADTASAKEPSKDRIAVMDLVPDGITVAQSRRISEIIRTELVNTGKYVVIERSQMDMIFKEHGFSRAGVTDDRNAVQAGKLLSAQKILIGTVMNFGGSFVITARIVDIEKGVAEYGAKASAASEEDVLNAVTELIEKLTGKQPTSSSKSSEKKEHTPLAVIKSNKKKYMKNEDIIVTFTNFPGTRYDYISIARKSSAANQYYTYQYTKKLKEGAITFSGLNESGEFEVRAHTEYHRGNQEFQVKYEFSVK